MRHFAIVFCLIAVGCGSSNDAERAAAEQKLKAAEQAYLDAQKEYERIATELGEAEKAIPTEQDETKKSELKQTAVKLEEQLQAQKQEVEKAINDRVKAQDRVNAFAE